MNGNSFLLYIPFSNVTLVKILNFQHHIFIILFFGEFSRFYMEIIWRFKCLIVEFKCLVSRVIALYTIAQLNKWNLQFCFLDFRIIFLANIFLKFFQCLLGRKALFFCSETKKNSSSLFFYYYDFSFSGHNLRLILRKTISIRNKILGSFNSNQ